MLLYVDNVYGIGCPLFRYHARSDMAVRPQPRLFTVEEYHRMGEAGILGEDDPVELINGEIVRINPIGSPPAALATRHIDPLSTHIPVQPSPPLPITLPPT